MLLLAGITYAEQRSFQYQRIDAAARAAPPAAAHALAEQGIGPAIDDHDQRGGRDPGGGPPPDGGPSRVLPQGTYLERLNAAGMSLGHGVAAYGEDVTANPDLPKQVPVGRLLTVHGRKGDDKRYRVYAEADPAGLGTTVVAIPL